VNGNMLWTKENNLSEPSTPYSLTATSSNGCVMVAQRSTGNTYTEMMCLSSTGTIVTNSGTNANLGYLLNGVGQQTSDGGFVTGSTQNNSGDPKLFIGKYTAAF